MAARRPVITFLALLLIAPLLLPGCGGGSIEDGVAIVIEDQTFQLEIAANEASIEKGMMFRPTFPDGTGMLFIFPDVKQRRFWMKNCLTDIDIIFMDGSGRVTATHRMKTEPTRREEESELDYAARLKNYTSGLPAQFAIELPPGTLDQLNVRIEDKIELDLERLKGFAH